jgi:hypothetical protein
MPSPILTLNASGITPANSYGHAKLAGCHITTNAAGTAYEFTEPNINNVLATAGPPLPTVPFSFPQFHFHEVDWTVTVNTLPMGANESGSGTWSTPGNGPDDTINPQNGDFTAQTGGIVTVDETAAAAGYGKK